LVDFFIQMRLSSQFPSRRLRLQPSTPELPQWLKDAIKAHRVFVADSVRDFGVPRCERENVEADIFAIAWARRDDFDPQRDFRAWLHGITRRRCSGYHRRARSDRRVFARQGERGKDRTHSEDATAFELDKAAADPEAAAVARDLLNELFKELTPAQVDLVVMDVQGFSTSELAAALRIAQSTVKARLRVAYDRLNAKKQQILARERHDTRSGLLLLLSPFELVRRLTAEPELTPDARGMVEAVRAALVRHSDDTNAPIYSDDAAPGVGVHDGRMAPGGLWGPLLQTFPALAKVGPVGAWLLSQAPAFVLGAATVAALQGALDERPSPTISAALHDEHVAVPALPGSAPVTPTAAPAVPAGAPPGHAEPPLSSATTTAHAGHIGADDTERKVIDIARTELSKGHPQAALSTLKRLDKVPGLQRHEEREAANIDGLIRMGQIGKARQAAEAFRRSYPHSIQLPRIDAALRALP
jgi:RNA polymerase sigma factor (sigma-70 family)